MEMILLKTPVLNRDRCDSGDAHDAVGMKTGAFFVAMDMDRTAIR
jgi:hypothetical protein